MCPTSTLATTPRSTRLGGLEVIIATVRDGTGTLVRWGKTVVDALNRVSPPANPSEARVRSAYLQFDMRNGARLMGQASASLEAGPAADSTRSISEAAFGLCGPDMQFPMRNVTLAKLLSLFAPLGGKTGTVVYTRTKEMFPSSDGQHIMAGNVRLQDQIASSWWLPPSAQLPWKDDLPSHRGASVSRPPFNVTLSCGGTHQTVDWQAHGWEAVVKEGAASGPMVVTFRDNDDEDHTIHYQIGWLNMDDPVQAALSGKMLMYRHARYTCTELLPRGRGGEECGRLNGSMEARGPAAFGGLHDLLQEIYCNGWPVEKAKMTKLTKEGMRKLLGETLVMLVSCHSFEWQEGKEAFAVNNVYPACLPALFSAAAEFALKHGGHPAVKAAEQAAKEAAEKKRKENADRLAAVREEWAKQKAEGGGAASAAGTRVRTKAQPFEPEAIPTLAVEGGGVKKRKASASGAAGGKAHADVVAPIRKHLQSAVKDWPAVRTAIAHNPVAVNFFEKLLSNLQATCGLDLAQLGAE